MRKVFVIAVVVLSLGDFLICETNQIANKDKSVGVGILLGSIGIAGLLVPGTMGWGNFYAQDYVGFAVLNIGGSILDIITIGAAISQVIQYGGGGSSKTPQYIVGTISGIGSWIFVFASIISGGASVGSYNLKNKGNKLGISFVPKIDGFEMELNHSF